MRKIVYEVGAKHFGILQLRRHRVEAFFKFPCREKTARAFAEMNTRGVVACGERVQNAEHFFEGTRQNFAHKKCYYQADYNAGYYRKRENELSA